MQDKPMDFEDFQHLRDLYPNMPEGLVSYEAYLMSEHWKETRLKAIQRASHKCQVCCSMKNLNVHHNTYVRLGCELDSDLVTLCKVCHTLFHNAKRLAEYQATQGS